LKLPMTPSGMELAHRAFRASCAALSEEVVAAARSWAQEHAPAAAAAAPMRNATGAWRAAERVYFAAGEGGPYAELIAWQRGDGVTTHLLRARDAPWLCESVKAARPTAETRLDAEQADALLDVLEV